ncbi:hypothetical protein QWZ10_13970 [Paracoccus cavernae]|uniref:TonB-system energizer ExbB n=1 Tax=Paracoccus cavernae TaxID=1571207 RepID=A0ABT8D9N8_9RHOB|nr:hypothetical protein [Paracoccus cavernae]
MIAPVLESGQRDPNLPHDLSPVGMFMAADIVVKAVMIGLAIASVVTWTVLVMKLLELGRASAMPVPPRAASKMPPRSPQPSKPPDGATIPRRA